MNDIRCHKQNDSPNRNDLSSFLKVVNDVEVERRAGGKLFHARGPATANARSPMDARRVDGTTRSYIITRGMPVLCNGILESRYSAEIQR